MTRLFWDIMHYVDGMRAQEWVIALVVVILVGAICLKGFGSRSEY